MFLFSIFTGQQQQFHAFAFGQRPFLSGHFAGALDPLQRAPDPLAFRMPPAMSSCQSEFYSIFFGLLDINFYKVFRGYCPGNWDSN